MSGKVLYKLVAIKKQKFCGTKRKILSQVYFSLDKDNMLYVWKPGCKDQEGYMLSSDYTNICPTKKGRMIHYKFIFDGDAIVVNKNFIAKRGNKWCGSELWICVGSTLTSCDYWDRLHYHLELLDEDILELSRWL
jgi:hypothetical protein